MADIKFSEWVDALSPADLPLTGNEKVVVIQDGVPKYLALSNLLGFVFTAADTPGLLATLVTGLSTATLDGTEEVLVIQGDDAKKATVDDVNAA